MFDKIRWKYANWYTAHPFDQIGAMELERIAQEVGMSVEELRKQAQEPRMQCPLCGRMVTHLTGCKGCGSGAWGYEFEEANGVTARQAMRRRLAKIGPYPPTPLLSVANYERRGENPLPDPPPKEGREDSWVENAYEWGGCMICADCWRHTLGAGEICPLYILSEIMTNGVCMSLFLAVLPVQSDDEIKRIAKTWATEVYMRWVEVWNTVPEGPEREAIKVWRARLLEEALAV